MKGKIGFLNSKKIEKLENIYYKLFIRWQQTFPGEKSKHI